MSGMFACPECGVEITLAGLTPGRQVRCEECLTLVEVPYFPRAGEVGRRTSRRGKRPIRAAALWSAAVVAAVVASGYLTYRAVVSRFRAEGETALEKLAASAEEAERYSRFDQALADIEAAIDLVRKFDPAGSSRAEIWRKRREDVLRLDVRRRLASLRASEPAKAAAEAEAILKRASGEEALASLSDTIREAVDEARRRKAEADLASARQLADAGRSFDSFEIAAKVHQEADVLPVASGRQVRASAEEFIRYLVRERGVILEPARMRCILGTNAMHESALIPITIEELKKHGYVPRPVNSPWTAHWSDLAPYRLTLDVVERQETPYLQSPSLASEIQGKMTLARPGGIPWSAEVTSRTQSPLPGLPAMVAARLGSSNVRSPDAEKVFYEDAKRGFHDRMIAKIRAMPSAMTR